MYEKIIEELKQTIWNYEFLSEVALNKKGQELNQYRISGLKEAIKIIERNMKESEKTNV